MQHDALREGIEATISQGVRAFGMRHSCYIGEEKTHLQHIEIAAAINIVRVVAWLDGELLAPTCVSAYKRLFKGFASSVTFADLPQLDTVA